MAASWSLAFVLQAATANAAAAQGNSAPAASLVTTVEVVPATLPTDLPVLATVYGFDAGGHLVGNITSQSVVSISPDGSCSAGRCYGTRIGSHTVTAAYGSGAARVVGTGTWTLFPGPATSVAVIGGDRQLAAKGTTFATALRVLVSDSDGDAVGGYLVQWRVTGGSASFPGGSSHTQSVTGTATGTATAPRLIAGRTSGPVSVTASVNGRTATVHLLVYAAPVSVSVAGGNHQLVRTGKRFPVMLRATVTDAAHQHLPGVAVTWRVKAGPARFAGGASRAGSTTTSTGQAVAPQLTAGRTTGLVTVTATVAGGGRTATYHLVVGRPPSMTSATSRIFAVGVPDRFTITTAGFPWPRIILHGSLPAGITFVDNRDGTATLAGTAQPGTQGTYRLLVDIENGVIDPQRALTLTVVDGPSVSAARGNLAVTGVNAAQQAALATALLLAGTLILLAARLSCWRGVGRVRRGG